MNDPARNDGLPLGRHVDYPRHYDAGLLFPIARSLGRHQIGVDDAALPFIGIDRWHAYELSWLDSRGKPRMATATLQVPAHSPFLIESKSLKLYLNSFNATVFDDEETVRVRIATDLSAAAGAPVQVAFGLPPATAEDDGESIDGLDVAIAEYGPPRAELLGADPASLAEEVLSSGLLKSNCPVTGQPDWATVVIRYRGPRLDRAALLRYLVSFRDHAEFHEQCVERIFTDLLARTRPQTLSVEARYTRRGGLDINPWRATPGHRRPDPTRDTRQ
ncbi:NADPH-dependent 7-cyano-7-deazaguanine reductase QueF [Marilutibacter chinensis]|uniref:NADPH-dependent 7-cyano-7-deazaguanine reductase n=1 Tax=Marilutibacter chinensis TaxID=2912247 RepID=A0ABS9HS04_9GAMM|nr:NADPH-dependent 7-cyano-7-deazaguanine reductase QueF [Lysobacter chinensis]MCF7221714.1 NADPH-dependent 7-cyano-7-deazaguanine reductase QueF [Lysobacter chinensis]